MPSVEIMKVRRDSAPFRATAEGRYYLTTTDNKARELNGTSKMLIRRCFSKMHLETRSLKFNILLLTKS